MPIITYDSCLLKPGLSLEARLNFKVSPKAALEPYLKLQGLATALEKAQPAAEDAAPHLIDHVNQVARSLWKQMKDDFSSDFEKTLKKMNWPGEKLDLTEALEHEWQTGVEKLLDLQEPYVEKSHPAGLSRESINEDKAEVFCEEKHSSCDLLVFSSLMFFFLFFSLLLSFFGRHWVFALIKEI